MARKAHQTTLRFSDEMWEALEQAAARRDVSVAQYVRDAAQARLDTERETPGEQRFRALATGAAEAQDHAFDTAEGTAAVRGQGQLARDRSEALRARSRGQRLGPGDWPDQPHAISENAAALWEQSRIARERAQLLRDRLRDFSA
jgi:Ribbon-helix-helix domain